MSSKKNNFWLVVEDDDDDFFLFCRACTQALHPEPIIHRAKDGLFAKTLLGCITPGLIVSDLKMPGLNGLELLEWLRGQDRLKNLRFVLLTNSRLEQDMKRAHRLGVDDYRVKPSEFTNLVQLIREIEAGKTIA